MSAGLYRHPVYPTHLSRGARKISHAPPLVRS